MKSFFIPVPTSQKSKKRLLLLTAICGTLGVIFMMLDGLLTTKIDLRQISTALFLIPLGIHLIKEYRKNSKA